MNKKKDPVLNTLSEICSNSLKDNNKKIYLEQILKYCLDYKDVYRHVWSQNGIPLLFLQEIIKPFYHLNKQSYSFDKLIVVLQILECLVQEDYIKTKFVDSRFHYYLFMYLTNYDINEKIRINVLKVFKILCTNLYVQSQIKNTEIIPIILKNIDVGNMEVKCLGIEIFMIFLEVDENLNFVTQTFDRFSAVSQVFNSICIFGIKNKSYEVIKLTLKVYIRLCDKLHIRNALTLKGPDNIINADMNKFVKDDKECNELYKKLRGYIEEN